MENLSVIIGAVSLFVALGGLLFGFYALLRKEMRDDRAEMKSGFRETRDGFREVRAELKAFHGLDKRLAVVEDRSGVGFPRSPEKPDPPVSSR